MTRGVSVRKVVVVVGKRGTIRIRAQQIANAKREPQEKESFV